MNSVRRSTRIRRPAEEVWTRIADAGAIHTWWPGIVATELEGDRRTIVLASGVRMPETIVTIDHVDRRFQYRLDPGLTRDHLSTIDVIELDESDSLVIYGVNATPRLMALVIGGAAGAALTELKTQLERT